MRKNDWAVPYSEVSLRQKLPGKKMLEDSRMAISLVFFACLIAGCFLLAANAAQAQPSRARVTSHPSKPKPSAKAQTQPSQAWVTSPVVAPRLEQRFFRSSAANAEVSYHVYTPELYDSDKAQRFPVIYWLHGSGGGEKGLPELVEHFDLAMREGKLPPTMIVFPNGMAQSMWVNSKDGKVPMEKVLIDELIPQVDATFRTIASRTGRLIEGFSMGGYGAARLGLKYPEIFGAVSIIAAGPMQLIFDAATGPSKSAAGRVKALKNVYGNDQAYFLAQSPWVMAERYASAAREKSKIRIAVGDSDDLMGPNKDFADHLSRLQVPHDFYRLPNVEHNPLQLFQAMGEDNWNFYRAALGGTASTVDSEAKDDTTKLKQQYDAAPEKRYPAQDNAQRRRMIERLKQFDYDGDGVIYLSDLPSPARERFQRLDTNRNGRIDASEYSESK